jgi:hypothetical protein
LTYTGRTFDVGVTGPGTITGIPAIGAGSIAYRIPVDTDIYIRVQVDDLVAQAALVAAGDTDGIYSHVIDNDHRLSIAGATERGEAELIMFAAEQVSGGFRSRDRFCAPGRTQSFNLPLRPLFADLQIQSATISVEGGQYVRSNVTFQSTAPLLTFADVIGDNG